MSNERASIFEADLSEFTPKQGPAKDTLPPEEIRAITEASHFPSREPKPRAPSVPKAAKPAPVPRAPSAPAPGSRQKLPRLRTFRDQQLNARASAQTVDDFYGLAGRHGWTAAETMEKAVAALKRETEGQGRGGA
jgi:type IV secretory pathway VirB10-like protein